MIILFVAATATPAAPASTAATSSGATGLQTRGSVNLETKSLTGSLIEESNGKDPLSATSVSSSAPASDAGFDDDIEEDNEDDGDSLQVRWYNTLR
jgi:hypothetical protein